MRVPGEQRDILLVNGNVPSLDAAQFRADTIFISRGRIRWIGKCQELSPKVLSTAHVIDCGGQTIVPGFIDAHCHVLAFAASLIAVDCSPDAVSSVDDIVQEIRRRAEATPQGEWIRATGYSEFDLRERRHPTRWELDRATSHHPIRLNHRSGHACVLNSVAMERVGIASNLEEPRGATIDRDLGTGEPNGLLLEMEPWLEDRIPPLSEFQLRRAVSEASRQFVSQGITSVMDATQSNSLERWNLLRLFRADGSFVPTLHVMPGIGRLDEFEESTLTYGYADELSSLGHAKIMLILTGGSLEPSPETLRDIVAAAHARGFPVAIHAVESDAVIAAAEALAANPASGLRDRIEHVSECPPDAMHALLEARPVVVSQPGFLHESGDRYLQELREATQWLYRFKTLIDNRIILAASSDAPVTAPDPMLAIHAAVVRRSKSGGLVSPTERITAKQALMLHTSNAAYAMCSERETGTIASGKRADLAVLSHDPTEIEPESLASVKVTMTIVNGEVVWGE